MQHQRPSVTTRFSMFVTFIGFMASMIGIFVFVTGIASIPQWIERNAQGSAVPSVTKDGYQNIEISADATQIRFRTDRLEAAAGQPIELTFTNPSTTLPHSWVLVQPGKEENVVYATIAVNGDPTNTAGVIAGSAPITDSRRVIHIPVLSVGSYSYLCTVPGHYQAGMTGTLKIW